MDHFVVPLRLHCGRSRSRELFWNDEWQHVLQGNSWFWILGILGILGLASGQQSNGTDQDKDRYARACSSSRGSSPSSMSSTFSLTLGVETRVPPTPSSPVTISACRGSASQEMPHGSQTMIRLRRVADCSQPTLPRGPRTARTTMLHSRARLSCNHCRCSSSPRLVKSSPCVTDRKSRLGW